MRRLLVLLIGSALLAVACGGDDAAPASAVLTSEAASDTTDAPATTEAETSTTEAGTSTSEAATGSTEPAATTPPPEGPEAPDFTLALGEGGSFTLSEAQKPVYMVFWAEW